MKKHMHKLGMLVAVFIMISISAFAAEEAPSNPFRTTSAREEINPPARPVAKDGIGLFVTGEFLWWKATLDDLQYVATTCADRCPTNIFLTSFDGKLHNPDFCFDVGFRAGVGYNTPYDGWDILFNWTRFHTGANDSQCACPDEIVTSLVTAPPPELNALSVGAVAQAFASGAACSFANPCGKCDKCCCPCKVCCALPCCCCPNRLVATLTPICTQDQYATTFAASSHWSLKLDFLDGELGREFYVSKKLTLRPFIGARGVWIFQHYNVSDCSNFHLIDPPQGIFNIASGTFFGQLTTCTKFQNNFQGGGPRLGLNSEWLLGGGFSLYGKAALSLIWGEFDLVADSVQTLCGEFTIELENPSENIEECIDECGRFRLCDEFCTTKAITDLALGLQWQKVFLKERLGLLLFIGWDHHLIFNQNQMIYFKQQINPFPLLPVVPIPPDTHGFTNLTTTQLKVEGRRRGDLTLQGLTIGARFDF